MKPRTDISRYEYQAPSSEFDSEPLTDEEQEEVDLAESRAIEAAIDRSRGDD